MGGTSVTNIWQNKDVQPWRRRIAIASGSFWARFVHAQKSDQQFRQGKTSATAVAQRFRPSSARPSGSHSGITSAVTMRPTLGRVNNPILPAATASDRFRPTEDRPLATCEIFHGALAVLTRRPRRRSRVGNNETSVVSRTTALLSYLGHWHRSYAEKRACLLKTTTLVVP